MIGGFKTAYSVVPPQNGRRLEQQPFKPLQDYLKLFPGVMTEAISKMRLGVQCCVAGRLKMLTYYRVCSAFDPPRALP